MLDMEDVAMAVIRLGQKGQPSYLWVADSTWRSKARSHRHDPSGTERTSVMVTDRASEIIFDTPWLVMA